MGLPLLDTMYRSLLKALPAVIAVLLITLLAQPAWAQLEATEVLITGQILEPGDNTLMTSGPTDLGDGAIVFSFKVEDIDPQANDTSVVEIDCFLIQNLGTATHSDVAQVMVIDSSQTAVAPPDMVGPPSDVAPVGSGCSDGAAAGSNISFEGFIATGDPLVPGDGVIIGDNDDETFEVAVLTQNTSLLQTNGSNGKTVRLRVIVFYQEEVGSPQVNTSFTLTISDSDQDVISNSGPNEVTQLDFVPAPISVGNSGVLLRFRVCDGDANTLALRINEITIVQGPLGSAIIDDFERFRVNRVTGGADVLWGEINSADAGFDSDFNRGGPGIIIPINGGLVISDETCEEFEIVGEAKATAFKGRVVQLRATISSQEPDGFDIDEGSDEVLQSIHTIMLGSGLVRIVDTQTPGGNVPIQISGFSSPGLGSILVQTRSVEFDPSVLHVKGVQGVGPYIASNVQIDNRNGFLKFNLTLSIAQSQSAKLGIPLPETVGNIEVISRGDPGDRTTMVFQADVVSDSNGSDLTDQVSIVSGLVVLPFFGDVDLLQDGATVKDILAVAEALMGCFENPPTLLNLSAEQKRIADVANPIAPEGTIPTCSYLSTADLVRIAQAAISQMSSSSVKATGFVAVQSHDGGDRRPFYIRWLAKLFPGLFGARTEEITSPALMQLIETLDETDNDLRLRIRNYAEALGGVQGVITYDPAKLNIDSIFALEGYRMMASSIDNKQGEVRFLMLGNGIVATEAQDILGMDVSGRDPGLELTIQYLIDPNGVDIPVEVLPFESSEPADMASLSVTALEISSQGNGGWTLKLNGQNIAGLRVDGFDLSGKQRFLSETEGAMARVQPMDMLGDRLANGVYLMVVTAKGINGERWVSEIRKVVVLR